MIGDPKRGKGSCVVFTREGMEHHERGTAEPLSAVPWSKVGGVSVSGAARDWHATRTGAFLNAFGGYHLTAGRTACSVSAYGWDPYKGWSVVYDRHERPYTYMHLTLVSDLFRRLSEAKAARLLGDPDWLAMVVAKLAPTPTWTPLPGRRVTELLRELGVV